MVKGEAMSEWISVKDRLPCEYQVSKPVKNLVDGSVDHYEYHKGSDLVLVTLIGEDGKRSVLDDILFDGEWANFPSPEWEVTHWMPLPDPPKED